MSATSAQLDKAISQLNTKLARQLEAVKGTEAHIEALKSLQAMNAKGAK